MAYEENEYNHLEELSGSDFEVVEGEPDITGWDVVNEQGQKIGEVDDLLFDKDTREVRYLVVDLGENELDLDTNKKVLVPIGVADLQQDDGDLEDMNDQHNVAYENDATVEHEHANGTNSEAEVDDADEDMDEIVIIPNVSIQQLSALPAYEKGKITPDIESAIRSIFDTTYATGTAYDRDSFYKHDHFDEDKFYNREKLPLIGGTSADLGDHVATTSGEEPRLGDEPVDSVIIVRDEQDIPENLIENKTYPTEGEHKLQDDDNKHIL